MQKYYYYYYKYPQSTDEEWEAYREVKFIQIVKGRL